MGLPVFTTPDKGKLAPSSVAGPSVAGAFVAGPSQAAPSSEPTWQGAGNNIVMPMAEFARRQRMRLRAQQFNAQQEAETPAELAEVDPEMNVLRDSLMEHMAPPPFNLESGGGAMLARIEEPAQQGHNAGTGPSTSSGEDDQPTVEHIEDQHDLAHQLREAQRLLAGIAVQNRQLIERLAASELTHEREIRAHAATFVRLNGDNQYLRSENDQLRRSHSELAEELDDANIEQERVAEELDHARVRNQELRQQNIDYIDEIRAVIEENGRLECDGILHREQIANLESDREEMQEENEELQEDVQNARERIDHLERVVDLQRRANVAFDDLLEEADAQRVRERQERQVRVEVEEVSADSSGENSFV